MADKSKYYQMVAEAIIAHADPIYDAIDRYLAKADEDLEDELKEEGYAEPKDTVSEINSLEEEIADILHSQTTALVTALKAADGDWDAAQENVSDMIDEDDIAEQVTEAANAMYELNIPKLATVYIQESDGELVVDTLRQRTSEWFASWSEQLGNLMKVNTHKQITDLIQETIANGDDIATLTRKIMDGGWRTEYYQAKRVAVTEVLRAHSVAKEEAIQQSPVVDMKEWRHTGVHKIKPRPNHVAMDGQMVPKDQPFEMQGKDGGTYYPMFPRDPNLPAGESINCHCIHRGIVNQETLGLSIDERKKMQQAFIDNDDGSWEKEQSEKEKAKAGIVPYEATQSRSVSQANTKAADKWAKTHLGVKKTNYTKQDIKAVNRVNRAMQRLYKEYPQLNGFIDEIRFVDNLGTDAARAAISKKGSEIKTVLKISSSHFADQKVINNLIKSQVEEGNWTPKSGAYGILKHEMVAESMRSFVNDYFRNKGYDRDCLISWTKKCIGTVHTFQGKGANEVLFVLGCSKMSVGAMNWVVKKANILNVAVTRAKYRIGFIGDMQDWKKLKYFREFIPYLIDEIQVDDSSCLFTS